MSNLSKLLFALLCIGATSCCTCSIIMSHTDGQATDLVDENQTPTLDLNADANISIPAAVL